MHLERLQKIHSKSKARRGGGGRGGQQVKTSVQGHTSVHLCHVNGYSLVKKYSLLLSTECHFCLTWTRY